VHWGLALKGGIKGGRRKKKKEVKGAREKNIKSNNPWGFYPGRILYEKKGGGDHCCNAGGKGAEVWPGEYYFGKLLDPRNRIVPVKVQWAAKPAGWGAKNQEPSTTWQQMGKSPPEGFKAENGLVRTHWGEATWQKREIPGAWVKEDHKCAPKNWSFSGDPTVCHEEGDTNFWKNLPLQGKRRRLATEERKPLWKRKSVVNRRNW